MEDKNQLKAIMSDSGPALILAGPGSGKTTVLTHHIKHLIKSGINPESILVITFTRKAALEMKSRFESLSPSSVHQAVFGTFHSIFFKIIKSFDNTDIKLVSTEERDSFLLLLTGDAVSAEYFGNHISFYKSLYDKSQYRFVNDMEKEEFMKVYGEYEAFLKSKKMIDYDDIIENCYKLLKSNKKVLSYLNKKFSHILVDEFQDINSLQYETLKLMAGKEGTIFAVGDEDQSIYGFRGATPDIMKRFLNDYSNASVINLNKNYRSFQDISDFSQNVIRNNPGRLRTDIPSCLKADGNCHVHLKIFKDRNEEIAELLKDFYKDSESSKSAAVLLRTNKEVFEYNKLLKESGRDDKTLKRGVIEDYLALTDYVLKRDIVSLKRIMSMAVPGIPTVILKDCESLNDIKRKLAGTVKADTVAVFETKLKVMAGLTPFSFALYARNIVGLFEYHKSNLGGLSEDSLVRIFEEITDISKVSRDFNDFKTNLKSIMPQKNKTDSDKNISLTVTTFHQAKGLEFDRVFIPDAVEGKIPAGMSVAECRVEEERRLFYVALTRAKDELFVYTIKNEESGGALPSRFLEEFIY